MTITAVGTNQGSSAVTDSATITAPPSPVITGAPAVGGSSKAPFTGSVNPDGLPTTAHFEYGLDSRYSKPGTSGPVYDHSTPAQLVGSDFTSHSVSASVSGLVPNALYHVRLVAMNAAGTTNGPDVTFTTQRGPAPGAPALGKTFNVSATGLVLIKVHGVFIPLDGADEDPERHDHQRAEGHADPDDCAARRHAARGDRGEEEAEDQDAEGEVRRRDLQGHAGSLG